MNKVLFSAVAAFAFAAIGCNKSPEGGATSGGNTFKLSAPTISTTVKQGETRNIDVDVSHGNDFKDDLTFEVAKDSVPKGVEASLSKDKIPATEKKVVLMVKAAADATLGEGKIRVNAKPGTGNATSVEVPVKIEAK